jgi:long-chain acyl-CoA synthetase
MNLYDVFCDTARKQPKSDAVLGPKDRLSYKRLNEAIDASAHSLQRAGLRPGDCVGLHVPSGVNTIIFTYAVWRCGGCAVPLPVELAAVEKQEICREIHLDLVVSEGRTASFLNPFRKDIPSELQPGLFTVPMASPLEHPTGFGALNSAFIRFTSGTTGTSKGVVLSHETIYDRIYAANEVLEIGPGDRVLWLLSMAYHFAVSIVSYLSFGAAIVLPPNHFAPAVLESSRRNRATLMYGSPTHYAWLAASEPDSGLSSLRLALSTTTAIEALTARRFHRCFGLPVVQALGIIEVGLPFINIDFAAERPEAVGRVLPAYRLRLEDVGLGPRLKEILLGGKGFLDAYYRPWRSRAEIMPDGWFRTGDLGERDDDGCVTIRGRSKEVISVGGMKFFPQDVERVLASHPGVDSACVFARQDARLGEVPYARVVRRGGTPSERELLDFCHERLADFKVPERIEFVASLRRTGSGKILHRDTDQPADGGDSHASGPCGREGDPTTASERR